MVRPLGDTPEVVPPIAGLSTTATSWEQTTKGCLTLGPRAVTPPNVRKWRKSNFSEPGQRVLHPGAIEDARALVAKGKIYGVSSKAAEHIPPVSWVREGRTRGVPSEAPEMKQAINEALYLSSKREPLGRPVERGHVLPEAVKGAGFRFGVSSSHCDSVKDLLYPHIESDDKPFHRQYIRSHQSYEPGEQKRRDYTWSIDPSNYRFGQKGGNIPYNGVSSAVAGILHGEPEAPKRTIATISQVNHQATMDRVGQPKALGNQGATMPTSHIFGKPSVRRGCGDWDAKACLQGGYSPDECEPDADLGKAVTPGFRNITADTRVYGVPSIRTDIPKYERRSIADSQNYGDDVNASYLLHPSQFASQGVEDEEFEKPRDKEELWDLFDKLGYGLSRPEFDLVFERAVAIGREGGYEGGSGNNATCSIHTFRGVLNEYFTAREYDTLDQWMGERA